MYRGTTPTFIFTLPDTVDLGEASHVYVSFALKDGRDLMTLTGDALEVEKNTVSVFMTQEETLALPVGTILTQLNWTYTEGGQSKRACSDIQKVYLQKSLEDKVLP